MSPFKTLTLNKNVVTSTFNERQIMTETAQQDKLPIAKGSTEQISSHVGDHDGSVSSNDKLARLVGKIDKSDISSIKQVVTKLVEIINDPDSGAKELKDVIDKDPPLSARLLKRANSAYYGYRRKIHAIQDAIVCVGFNTVRELAISQKVSEVFQDNSSYEGYSRPALWEHSFAVALCSKLTYTKEFRQPGENIYVAGLLHDLGIIAEDQFLQNEFRLALQESKRNRQNLPDTEKKTLGFNHSDIGREIADSWEFPYELVKAIGSHHDPEKAEDQSKRVILTLYISDYICQRNEIGYCDAPYKKDERLYYKCLKELGIKGMAMNLIVEDVQKEISDLKSAGWL
ncbi:MAG: HDOD domain-containing protein [Desulfobacteraceae bacterium]|nr:HDOD domain-containing protein [Desulfobacteraceae bacterium]